MPDSPSLVAFLSPIGVIVLILLIALGLVQVLRIRAQTIKARQEKEGEVAIIQANNQKAIIELTAKTNSQLDYSMRHLESLTASVNMSTSLAQQQLLLTQQLSGQLATVADRNHAAITALPTLITTAHQESQAKYQEAINSVNARLDQLPANVRAAFQTDIQSFQDEIAKMEKALSDVKFTATKIAEKLMTAAPTKEPDPTGPMPGFGLDAKLAIAGASS